MSVTLEVLDENGKQLDWWDDGLACRPYYGLYSLIGKPGDLDETVEDSRCTLLLFKTDEAKAAVMADASLPNREQHLRLLDVMARQPGRWRLVFRF